MLHKELIYAALGTGATCLATVLGAALVFFFKKEMSHLTQKVFLGFAAGVMVAASVWSLLIPAMDMAREGGGAVLLPVAGGFVLGGAFLLVLDGLLPHLHVGSSQPEGLPAHWKRTTMIVLAVTLHNIPEGMAVGLSFSVAALALAVIFRKKVMTMSAREFRCGAVAGVLLFISYYFWKKMRGYRFFRVVLYLPHIISSVVMVILYKNIIAPNGLIGAISIKLTGETVPPWLYQDGSAIWAVWIYNTWMGFGGDFLLLTAALTRIPEEVIESAQLDGITPFKEYFKICIPLIWPTLHIILLQKIAAILAADGPILLLTNGNNNTYTLGFWSYMQVIVGHSYEFPSAVGILMTAAVAPIAITSRKLLSKVYQDVEY